MPCYILELPTVLLVKLLMSTKNYKTDIMSTKNTLLYGWHFSRYSGTAGKNGLRCWDLMVSVLASRLSVLGSSPDQGYCLVFLGKDTQGSYSFKLLKFCDFR